MFHVRNGLSPDFTDIAALLGDPSRALMLQALADGRALPATDLARWAGVTPQTASAHLARLVGGNIVTMERQGRHRYFCLTPSAAELLETMAAFPGPVRSSNALRSGHDRDLRFARTCYSHLAGLVG